MTNFLNLRKFVTPEIIFGNGARHLIGRYAQQFLASKVLLVSDAGVIAAGWLDDVKHALENMDIPYVVYHDVSPNPRTHQVMQGAEIYRENGCDVIIAVGGGSPMDCAKGIGIVCSNHGIIQDFTGVDKIGHPVPPLLFIPTTAGTSADVSQFAIISDRDNYIKLAIISKAIVPDVALIDPETTTTMESYLTACTGMDALVHAIEAYVSSGSGVLTDSHAREAITLVYENLPLLMNGKEDKEIREKIMLASMKAGLAFSNASLGAVHAMAHSLGGLLDLPHGECNSLLLEHVINFNYKSAPERFNDIAHLLNIQTNKMTQLEIQQALFNTIQNFKNAVGIKEQLHTRGVKSADIAELSKKAVQDACMLTNPRQANKDDIQVIFSEAM